MQNNEYMAILCFSHFSGGMELDALKLANAFDQYGIKTTLVCREGSLIEHRHLHKLAQTLYTLTKISTGYLGQPL